MEDVKDLEIQCRDCGQPFTWSVGEQQYYAANQLKAPKRCKLCRQSRKAQHNAALAAKNDSDE